MVKYHESMLSFFFSSRSFTVKTNLDHHIKTIHKNQAEQFVLVPLSSSSGTSPHMNQKLFTSLDTYDSRYPVVFPTGAEPTQCNNVFNLSKAYNDRQMFTRASALFNATMHDHSNTDRRCMGEILKMRKTILNLVQIIHSYDNQSPNEKVRLYLFLLLN